MNLPTVSVVMAVYNGERYLRPAIESILGQTWADFEFIIVNDGSTDDTAEIIEEYARADARIVRARSCDGLEATGRGGHAGLVPSLNRGLALARGRYIARQDADDVSRLDRLVVQVEYLERHPRVGLLGTAYTEIGPAGEPGATVRLPPTDTGIRWRMLFHNPFCHSSVMFRRKLLQGSIQGYNPAMDRAEDYDLWIRLLRRARGANIQEPLLLRRVHSESVTATRLDEQERISTTIAARQIANLAPWLELTREEVGRLRHWTGAFPAVLSAEDLPLCRKFLSILSAFESLDGLDPAIVERIRDCWHDRVRAAVGETTWAHLNDTPATPVAAACHCEEVQYE